jgi:hypothetical protein
MKLLTKTIQRQLPPLYAQDHKGGEAIAYLKLFAPWGRHTWFITEYDPVERRFFGLVVGQVNETGYFSLDELEAIRGPMGLSIERDLHWTPRSLREIEHLLNTRGFAGLAAAPQVEDLIAQNMQLLVREAFAWTALQDPQEFTKGTWAITAGVAHAVRRSWLTGGRTAASHWIDPNPYVVLIFTECCPPRGAEFVVRDPYRDTTGYDHRLWNRALERLRQNPWIADAGWESINAAVHYVWIKPRIMS